MPSSERPNISIFSQQEFLQFIFFSKNFLGSASSPDSSAPCTAPSDSLADFLHAGARIWTWVNRVLPIGATPCNAAKHLGTLSSVRLPFPAHWGISNQNFPVRDWSTEALQSRVLITGLNPAQECSVACTLLLHLPCLQTFIILRDTCCKTALR